MSLETVLKCRIVGEETPLPKLNPTDMTYWRKATAKAYHDHTIRLVPPTMEGFEFHQPEDVQDGDFVQINKLLFPVAVFMQKLEAAGFLKLCKLGRPVGTQHF
ncbi:hypothetical protein D3C85_603980 [compost metagenome]